MKQILLKTTLAIATFMSSVANAFADYSDHGRSYALDDDAPYIPHPIIRVIGCAFITLLAGAVLYGKITHKDEKDDDGCGKWIVFLILGILGVVYALKSCS